MRTGLFVAGGNLASESTREFLKKFIDAFAAWIELHLAASK